MVAQLVSMRRLGLDILSSGVTKKTRLDCGESKFAATAEELNRDDMTPLPTTQGQDELTSKEIMDGLRKMNKNKACGLIN